KLLAISTISVTLRPRQDRNDDLKPLEAREKRSSRSSTEKTDRSKVARSPNTIVFINTCDQIVCVSNVVRYSRTKADHDKYRLSLGDILVIRMADPGKVGIVEQDVDAVFASYLVRLT